ncbi:hypothetical protein HDV01_002567 [Terramyces sp. JEL0728]|nr:hypothetical protein HDV01_002567 [Terramyces sp. JEL0728]
MNQLEILKECGQEFLTKPKIINQTLQKIESCFNSQKSQIRQQAFIEWEKLIYSFRSDLNLKKIKLILVPILNCLKFEKNSNVIDAAKEALVYLAIFANGLVVYELANCASVLDDILLRLYSDLSIASNVNSIGVEQLGKPYKEIINLTAKPIGELEITKIKFLLEKNKLFPIVVNYFSYLWNEKKSTAFDLLNMITIHFDQHFSKEDCTTITNIKIPIKKGNNDLKILRYLIKLVDKLIQINPFDELAAFSKVLKQEGIGKSPLSLIKRLKNESPARREESSPLKREETRKEPPVDLGNIFEYPESIQTKKTATIPLSSQPNLFDDTFEKSIVLCKTFDGPDISLPFDDNTKSIIPNGDILHNMDDLSKIFGQDPNTPKNQDPAQTFDLDQSKYSLLQSEINEQPKEEIPPVLQDPSMIQPKELYDLSTIQPQNSIDQSMDFNFDNTTTEKENRQENSMMFDQLQNQTIPFQPQNDTIIKQISLHDIETTPVNKKEHKRKKRQSTEYISVSTSKPTIIHQKGNAQFLPKMHNPLDQSQKRVKVENWKEILESNLEEMSIGELVRVQKELGDMVSSISGLILRKIN